MWLHAVLPCTCWQNLNEKWWTEAQLYFNGHFQPTFQKHITWISMNTTTWWHALKEACTWCIYDSIIYGSLSCSEALDWFLSVFNDSANLVQRLADQNVARNQSLAVHSIMIKHTQTITLLYSAKLFIIASTSGKPSSRASVSALLICVWYIHLLMRSDHAVFFITSMLLPTSFCFDWWLLQKLFALKSGLAVKYQL